MRRHLLSSEAGFTLIELLVAALIFVIGGTALAAIFIGTSNQASADVRESQLINIADQQIELVRANVQTNGFVALAMTGVPTAVTLPSGVAAMRTSTYTDPNRWVAPGTAGASTGAACLQIQANYDSGTASSPPSGFNPWSNCQSPGAEPLAVPTSSTTGATVTVTNQGSGGWAAGTWPPPACPAAPAVTTPCTQTAGTGYHVIVYTFVTYSYSACSAASASGVSQASCPTLTNGTVTGCTGGSFPASASVSTPCGDIRRVTVAVVPYEGHTLTRQTPVYVSTFFTNPDPSTSQSSQLGLHVGASL